MKKHVLYIFIIIFFANPMFMHCSSHILLTDVIQKKRPDNKDVITFYALGDWGTGNENQIAVANSLRENIRLLEKNEKLRDIPPFVLGLGDNIYKKGLPKPDKNSPLIDSWKDKRIPVYFDKFFGKIYDKIVYKGTQVKFHLVSGNHDHGKKFIEDKKWGNIFYWETIAENRYKYLKYYPIIQDKYQDTNDFHEYERLSNENIDTLAMPQIIEHNIKDQIPISIITLDTQIMLNLYKNKNSSAISRHWNHFDELLKTDINPWKIVIGHHPLKTYGWHGGLAGYKQLLWSGTRDFLPKNFRPIIPISTLAAFLSFTGDKFYQSIQDTDNKDNKKFQKDITAHMTKHNILVYLAGHEHNLQLIGLGTVKSGKGKFEQLQIVSGSAGKVTPLPKWRNDLYHSQPTLGYVRIDISNDEMWLEFIHVDATLNLSKSAGLYKVNGKDKKVESIFNCNK